MSIEGKDIPRAEADGGGDETRASVGWLTALRQRFGLGPQSLRETLEYALRDEEADTAFSAGEREMLKRLLRFGASRVEDIMVPRADIIALDESEPMRELMKTFYEAGVSRIPVFHDTLDDPRGMIHIKDLFRWLMTEAGQPARGVEGTLPAALAALDLGRVDLSRPISAAKLRRQVLYVPQSMPATNLLIRMQTTRIHMALVVDEYGGTDGLITIEDLVEQIVGDIEDEHDEAEVAHIVEDAKIGLVASGRTPVADLEKRLGVTLLDEETVEEIDTLGGLVFTIVGRVPARGEIVRHESGIEFEVLDADPRRVKRLKIHDARPATATTG